jgi:hypothetical protein
MNKVIFLILILVIVFSIICKFNQKENFNDNILLLMKGNDIKAQFNNISQYIVFDNIHKSKGLIFNGTNTNIIVKDIDTATFTLNFYFQCENSKKKQGLVICNKFSVYINNESLILKKGNEFIKSDKVIFNGRLYFLSVAVQNNTIKLNVNGKENIRNIGDGNITTSNITIGKDENNLFKGQIGGILVNNTFDDYNKVCKYSDLCDGFKDTDESILNVCKFVPHGQRKVDCVNKCLTKDNCDANYCQEICDLCTNPETCKWVEPEVTLEDIMSQTTPPKSFEIKAIPLNEQILLQWKYNENLTGGSPITNYIIIVKESFGDGRSKRISLHKEPQCVNCEHYVTGLKNQIYYDISIRAVNNNGIGLVSNIETVSPIGEKKLYDISNTLLESDLEIAQKVSKDTQYENTSCGNASSLVNDNHVLNSEYNNLYDHIKNIS